MCYFPEFFEFLVGNVNGINFLDWLFVFFVDNVNRVQLIDRLCVYVYSQQSSLLISYCDTTEDKPTIGQLINRVSLRVTSRMIGSSI